MSEEYDYTACWQKGPCCFRDLTCNCTILRDTVDYRWSECKFQKRRIYELPLFMQPGHVFTGTRKSLPKSYVPRYGAKDQRYASRERSDEDVMPLFRQCVECGLSRSEIVKTCRIGWERYYRLVALYMEENKGSEDSGAGYLMQQAQPRRKDEEIMPEFRECLSEGLTAKEIESRLHIGTKRGRRLMKQYEKEKGGAT